MSFKKFKYLILTFGISASGYPQTQDFQFEHLSTDQGLSSGTINVILQDRHGFLWLGKTDGLFRYDGYTFKAYRHDPEDSHSISGNHVWSLCEDSSGDLWVGTSGRGLNRYLRSEDRFVRYKHDPEDSTSLAGDHEVPWIYRDAGGDIWIALWEAGLDRYDREADGFLHYPMKIRDLSGVPRGSVHRIYEDRMGMLWIGTKRGLIRFDRRRNATKIYRHDPGNPQSLGGNYVYAITEDRQGNLWVGCSDGGLSRYVRRQDAFAVYRHDPKDPASLSSDAVTAFCVDSSGALWVGTNDSGLNRFDPATQQFSRYIVHTGASDGFSSNSITSLYVDRTGILWIGAVGGGLNRLDPRKRKFAHFRTQPGNPLSLSAPIVDALTEDGDGVLWVGTAGGGLNRFDFEKNEVEHYLHEPNNPKSLSANFVSALVEDKHGDLWVGVYGGGLNRFNYRSKTFTRYLHEPDNPQSLSSNLVTALLVDRQGRLWIGTDGQAVSVYDESKDGFINFGSDPKSVLYDWRHVFAIFEDSQGDIWIGFWGDGVTQFDPSSNKVMNYKNTPKDTSTISGENVISIAEDTREMLWFGTWGEGLNRLNPATNTFTRYTAADGLPGETVYGILPDDQGNLWISTSNGLAKFNPESGVWKAYEERDGIQSTEFRRAAYHKGRSGRFYFGGVNGFNAFYPEEIKANPHIPPIVLTSFKIFDQEVAPTKIGGTIDAVKEISLSYKDNFFSFEFVALDYTNPQKNQYAYKLQGFDEDWIYSGNRRYASYTNLDAGEYIFRVKGSNNDGIWNEEGASVKIIITPPYWQTWWFRGLTASLILLIAFAGYRLRVAKLLEMERLRVRIASDLHDDIGSTLTKISLYSDLIETGTEPKTTKNLLNNIGTMSRELVTTMSDVVWSIDARNDTIGDLIDRMRDFAASTCSPKQIEVQFKTSGLESNTKIPVDVRQNLYLIFKEAVNNVAKHAKASKVMITLENTNGKLRMEIRDDGIGFPAEPRRRGQGLRNMKMRAERIGAKLEVDANEGVSVILEGRAI